MPEEPVRALLDLKMVDTPNQASSKEARLAPRGWSSAARGIGDPTADARERPGDVEVLIGPGAIGDAAAFPVHSSSV